MEGDLIGSMFDPRNFSSNTMSNYHLSYKLKLLGQAVI